MKRSNDFLKIHDILVFLDLSVSIANVTIDLCHRKCFNIILPFLLYSLGENKLYTLIIFYLSHKINEFNTKVFTHYWIICLYSINILYNIFIFIFYFFFYFLISFRICSTPKLSKYDTFSAFTYKATQWVPIDSYS